MCSCASHNVYVSCWSRSQIWILGFIIQVWFKILRWNCGQVYRKYTPTLPEKIINKQLTMSFYQLINYSQLFFWTLGIWKKNNVKPVICRFQLPIHFAYHITHAAWYTPRESPYTKYSNTMLCNIQVMGWQKVIELWHYRWGCSWCIYITSNKLERFIQKMSSFVCPSQHKPKYNTTYPLLHHTCTTQI